MDKSIDISQVFAAAGKSIWFTAKATATIMVNNAVLIVKRRNELARQRYQLSNMDDAQLRDLGITREMAEKEAARSAWDDPLSSPKDQQLVDQIIQKRSEFAAKGIY